MAHVLSSTNVRLRVAGWLVGTAGWFAPRWTAARLVDYAATTRGRRSRSPSAGSARVDVREADGRPFVTYTWGEGPAVYLQHGWDGSAADFGALAAALVARGLQVIAIDAPGHGAAPGTRSNLVVLANALRTAIAAGPAPLAVIGHSLGATAVGVAARDGAPVGRAVLMAPYPDVRRYFGALGAVGGPRLQREVLRLIRRVAGRDLGELGLRTTGAALRGAVLTVHDREDKQVPYRDVVELCAEQPHLGLRSTVGLGHRRILSDPAVVEEVVAFLLDARERSCGHGSVRALCESCALEADLYARA